MGKFLGGHLRIRHMLFSCTSTTNRYGVWWTAWRSLVFLFAFSRFNISVWNLYAAFPQLIEIQHFKSLFLPTKLPIIIIEWPWKRMPNALSFKVMMKAHVKFNCKHRNYTLYSIYIHPLSLFQLKTLKTAHEIYNVEFIHLNISHYPIH